MKVTLKKDHVSSKFGITFPKRVELNHFVYSGKHHVEHPTRKGVLLQVKSTDFIFVPKPKDPIKALEDILDVLCPIDKFTESEQEIYDIATNALNKD